MGAGLAIGLACAGEVMTTPTSINGCPMTETLSTQRRVLAGVACADGVMATPILINFCFTGHRDSGWGCLCGRGDGHPYIDQRLSNDRDS